MIKMPKIRVCPICKGELIYAGQPGDYGYDLDCEIHGTHDIDQWLEARDIAKGKVVCQYLADWCKKYCDFCKNKFTPICAFCGFLQSSFETERKPDKYVARE
jgi:hypothetical protein